jgi:hypothetical protein
VIVRNITMRLFVNGQQAEARFSNLALEMNPGTSVKYTTHVNTCTGEIQDLKVKVCSSLHAELKVDVEVHIDSKLVYEHPDFVLVSRAASYCTESTGQLSMFVEALREPDICLPMSPYAHRR